MKKRVVYISALAVAIAALLLGCDPPKVNKPILCRSFMDSYTEPSKLRLKAIEEEGCNAIELSFSGMRLPRGEKPGPRYDEIATKYNDLSYNKYKFPVYDHAYSKALSSVRIVTLTDYNSDYPKDSDMSAAVLMEAYSYYPFIRSGYQLPEGAISDSFPVVRLIKPLIELTEEEMTLLVSQVSFPILFFTVLPETAEQTFGVEVVLEDGTEFTEELNMVFDLSLPPYQPK